MRGTYTTRSRTILVGVTAPETARAFLRGHLRHLTESGWDVHLTCEARAWRLLAERKGSREFTW